MPSLMSPQAELVQTEVVCSNCCQIFFHSSSQFLPISNVKLVVRVNARFLHGNLGGFSIKILFMAVFWDKKPLKG